MYRDVIRIIIAKLFSLILALFKILDSFLFDHEFMYLYIEGKVYKRSISTMFFYSSITSPNFVVSLLKDVYLVTDVESGYSYEVLEKLSSSKIKRLSKVYDVKYSSKSMLMYFIQVVASTKINPFMSNIISSTLSEYASQLN